MKPSEVLFEGRVPKSLPVCDHYCGTEVRMKKALALQQELGPCFDITFDCEDGAPMGEEEQHAFLVARLINSPENQFARVGVRVHDPQSPFFTQDIEILIKECGNRLAYITIPKVESAVQVSHLIEQINSKAAQHEVTTLIPIHVLIETHTSLADAMHIASLAQIECLSFGLMDFVSAHYGAIPASAMNVDQFNHPLIQRAMLDISAACHRFAITPSHNVCTEIHDVARIRDDCLKAKDFFGYTRKWSIHPNQIPVIVEAFSPQNQQVDEAVQILLAAQNAHWGPIQYDGKLHDRASYRFYWMVLQRAKSSGKNFSQLNSLDWFN
ncbi:lyase [Polynucleobacter sp. SHI8]|uniref:HpcH/HpaI aldolase/citrate lyase family protein n=1 Tax=unclassified Polynucleobacter TaxID=2640945 RepID=UPI002491D80F|nr:MULTISPECIES: CoA ester lyase [unclassified Polynucleobacter]BDW11210.1 lyase [Polynucleobacter sp. SHI2]BDW13656.1 lyase [Polynucleobacter sp. SHI8]